MAIFWMRSYTFYVSTTSLLISDHAYLQFELPKDAEQSLSTYCQGFPEKETKPATTSAQHGSQYSRHQIKLLKNNTYACYTIHFIAKMISCSKGRKKEKLHLEHYITISHIETGSGIQVSQQSRITMSPYLHSHVFLQSLFFCS